MLKKVILLVLVLNVYVAVNTNTQSNLRSHNATEGSCFKVDNVMDVVEAVDPTPPCQPLELYSDEAFNGICTGSTPCSRCIGECDADTDCAGDLECFQRDGFANVPGCLSFGPGDYADYDYCYDPSCPLDNSQTCGPLPLYEASNELTGTYAADGICTESTPCGQCNGECDSDSQCAGTLVCFQRNGYTKVPGCLSGGSSDIADFDFCVHPQCAAAEAAFAQAARCEPLELYSDSTFDGICTSSTPCTRCMGECDSDTDCAGNLQCFQRNGYVNVPGCLSFGQGDYADYDYCYDPSCPLDNSQTCGPLPLVSEAQADGICTDSTPCAQCNGECDSDSQCAGNLVCFQRNGFTKVPGCTSGGSGDIADFDFCVHPACAAAEAGF